MTERQQQHAVYVISVFAELAGVHPQTLRNYERGGLLNPQRTSGGSRRFSDADLAALRRIQELTNEGVNLEGVKKILRLESELAEASRATRRCARPGAFECRRGAPPAPARPRADPEHDRRVHRGPSANPRDALADVATSGDVVGGRSAKINQLDFARNEADSEEPSARNGGRRNPVG